MGGIQAGGWLMVSITPRTHPSGNVTWRVQFRIDGRLTERRFPTRDLARAWFYGGNIATIDAKPQAKHASSEVMEELEFFLSLGEAPNAVCNALRMSPSAVQRACFRAGRPDLARRVEVC